MASGEYRHYRVWHAPIKVTNPDSAFDLVRAYGNFRDSQLLVATEVIDPKAPDYPTGRFELNFPLAGDHVWNWRKYVKPDDMLAVVSDARNAADRHVLFCGYVVDGDWQTDAAGNESCTIVAVGEAFRLMRDWQYLVCGRYMTARDTIARYYSALRCSFNHGGWPNMYDCQAEDAAHSCNIFTADSVKNPLGDVKTPAWWRALDAIEYLLAMYNTDETYMLNPTFTAEQKAASPVVQVDVDGLGLWEAIAKIADHGSYDVKTSLSIEQIHPRMSKEVVSTIELVKIGNGPEIILDHQAPDADGVMPQLDIDETNLFEASASENTSSCITQPTVAGGREIIEITIPLQGAFNIASITDYTGEVVRPGQEKAQSASDYVKYYCTIGSAFDDYSAAGRLWDANTDGQYSAAPYYASVPDMGALTDETAGTWPVMPYEIRPMLTKLTDSPRAGGRKIVVEFTVDGGANWYILDGCRIIPGRLAVWINKKNLAAIVPAVAGLDDSENNFFYKLQNAASNVKLRLTCCVADPTRTVIVPVRGVGAGTAFSPSYYFDKGALGQVRRRATSSKYYGSSYDADEFDGSADLETAALALRDLNQDRFIEAAYTIEFLDPVNTPLCGIIKRVGGIELDMRTNTGAAVRYPRVVRRTFRLTGNTYQTELTLCTNRRSTLVRRAGTPGGGYMFERLGVRR